TTTGTRRPTLFRSTESRGADRPAPRSSPAWNGVPDGRAAGRHRPTLVFGVERGRACGPGRLRVDQGCRRGTGFAGAGTGRPAFRGPQVPDRRRPGCRQPRPVWRQASEAARLVREYRDRPGPGVRGPSACGSTGTVRVREYGDRPGAGVRGPSGCGSTGTVR